MATDAGGRGVGPGLIECRGGGGYGGESVDGAARRPRRGRTTTRSEAMATATAEGVGTPRCSDGRWSDADGGKTLAVINPADESTIAEVAFGGRAEAERAIDAAARAMPDWRARPLNERAKILKRTADLMRERADRIARILTQEQGKPLAEAKGEVL